MFIGCDCKSKSLAVIPPLPPTPHTLYPIPFCIGGRIKCGSHPKIVQRLVVVSLVTHLLGSDRCTQDCHQGHHYYSSPVQLIAYSGGAWDPEHQSLFVNVSYRCLFITFYGFLPCFCVGAVLFPQQNVKSKSCKRGLLYLICTIFALHWKKVIFTSKRKESRGQSAITVRKK